MSSINVTRFVPSYDDANFNSIKKEFKGIRPSDIVDIANSWEIESAGLSEINSAVNEIDAYIASLLDKIEEKDKMIGQANDTIESLTTETNALLNFVDGIEIFENVDEIIDWCKNNLNGNWDYFLPPKDSNFNQWQTKKPKYVCIYMNSDEDKIHFKLRWL